MPLIHGQAYPDLLTRPLGRVIGVGLSPVVGGKSVKYHILSVSLKNGPTEKLFSFTDICTSNALIFEITYRSVSEVVAGDDVNTTLLIRRKH